MLAGAGALLAIGVAGLAFCARALAPMEPTFVFGTATTCGVWLLCLTYIAWCEQKTLTAEAERLRQRVAELEARVGELTKA